MWCGVVRWSGSDDVVTVWWWGGVAVMVWCGVAVRLSHTGRELESNFGETRFHP